MTSEARENERFLRLQIQAAWLYYIKDLTKQEIATRLGISRVKVTRLIQQARENELVTISINSPDTLFFEQQEGLMKQFGLQDALVTVSAGDEETLMPILANATANFLATQLKPNMVVGIGVGRTVSLIPRYFQPGSEIPCTFIELSGGPTAFLYDYAQADVLYRLAEKAGGKAVHLKAPFFVENAEAREILLRDPVISQTWNWHETAIGRFFRWGCSTRSQLVQHASSTGRNVSHAEGWVIGDVITTPSTTRAKKYHPHSVKDSSD